MLDSGSWGGEFHPELLPKEGDLIAQNHWTASGFANTNLDFLLKQHNIDHVATVEVNFPSYGHALLSTEEFINALNTNSKKNETKSHEELFNNFFYRHNSII